MIGAPLMLAAFLSLSLLVPDTRSVFFGAVKTGEQIAAATPAQIVFLEAPAPPVGTGWVAVSTQPWLTVTPQRGNGPSRLSINLAPSMLQAARSGDRAQIRIRFADGSPEAVIDAALTVLSDRSAPPIGSVDAPVDGFVGADGFARLSGWALDDVAVSRIEICADRAPAASERRCSDGTRALLGQAAPYSAARPDVAALFPTVPLGGRASWSFVLALDALPPGRRGTTRVFATAYGSEGPPSVLGSRNITLTEPPRRLGPVRWGLVAVAVFLIFHSAVGYWLLRNGQAPALPVPAAPRLHTVEVMLLAAALAVSALLSANGLSRGFSYDEMFSASHFIVDTPLWTAATRTVTFNNHYAFSLLAGLSTRLLGHEEWALRLPAVLLAMAAVVVSWVFARRMAGPAAGVAAAVVLGLMPGFVEWSHSARGYSGLALMAVWSTYCFTRVVRTGSWRAAATHGVTLILAFYFHLYALWVFTIQYLAFAARAVLQRRRPQSATGSLGPLWWSFGAAIVGTFILYMPMLADLAMLMPTRQRTEAIDPSFGFNLLSAFAGPVSLPVIALLGALLCAGLPRVWRTLEGGLLAAMVTVPVLLVWLVIRPLDLHTRYVAFVLPLVAVLMGVGAADVAGLVVARLRRPPGPVPFLPAIGVLTILLALPVASWVRIGLAPPTQSGYRDALSRAGARTGPVVSVGGDAEMFDYYLGKPMAIARAPEDLDRLMRAESEITVFYHDVPWNSPEQKATGALLRRRCEQTVGGTVTRFTCQ